MSLCRTEGGDLYIGQVWPGDTAFPDFVTEEARTWWGELNAAHVQSGLAGIWNDMNEPATGSIPPYRMRFDRGRCSHERYHNQYALLMAMGTSAGLRQAMPEQRSFVLSRAGFAGIQRYAANWLGDNQSRWDHLWVSMPMGMGCGLSGQPFIGADIGGFQGNSNAELFLRWMQYGTLTPFCRNHSEIGNVDQYAWSWGEVVQELVRAAIRLRYRLMPYLYATFLHAAETGAPIQRPLVFDYQYDPTVRDIDDQYLLGARSPRCAGHDSLAKPRGMSTSRVDAGTTGTRAMRSVAVSLCSSRRRWIGFRSMHAAAPSSRCGPRLRPARTITRRRWNYISSCLDGDSAHRTFLQEDDGLTIAAQDGAMYRTTFELIRADRLSRCGPKCQVAGFPSSRAGNSGCSSTARRPM